MVGLLVPPIVPALISSAVTRLGPAPRFDFVAFLGLSGVFYFYYAVATVGFGLPAFLLAARFNLVRWWSATGAEVAGGAIVALIFRAPNPPQTHDCVVLISQGAFTGFCFWVIWRVGEPIKARRQDSCEKCS